MKNRKEEKMQKKNEIAVIEKNKIFEKLHLPTTGKLSKSDCVRLDAELLNYDIQMRSKIIALLPDVQKNIFSDYKDITEDVLSKNEVSENQLYQAGQSIIDNCNEKISDPNTSQEELERCHNDRITVFTELEKDKAENREFHKEIQSNTMNFLGTITIGLLLALCAKQLNSGNNA